MVGGGRSGGEGAGAASRSDDESAGQFWDAYESGIYRKPHLNERAFISSISREQQQHQRGATDSPTVSRSGANNRPDTPPVDYDRAPAMNGHHHNHQHQQSNGGRHNNNRQHRQQQQQQGRYGDDVDERMSAIRINSPNRGTNPREVNRLHHQY